MNNRKHNATNPNQGTAKKVLCVCSAGLLRSPTAANVLHWEYGFNTRAAGLVADYALIPVDGVLLHWADEVVCMDRRQKDLLESMLIEYKIEGTEVVSLDVPDMYGWMDVKLQAMILKAYKKETKYD